MTVRINLCELTRQTVEETDLSFRERFENVNHIEHLERVLFILTVNTF